MFLSRKRFTALLSASVLAGAAALGTAGTVAAASDYVCSGGSVPGGTYASLHITGHCVLDSGNVTVNGNVTVTSWAELLGARSDSNLTVWGNLYVRAHGALILGCEPNEAQCADDSNAASDHWIQGNLIARYALAVIVHHSTIVGNVNQRRGGGGAHCVGNLDGGPAYSDYEDSTVGGNLRVSGINSCWFGLVRMHVFGNVTLKDNAMGDSDGNEVVTNHISDDLTCSGNSPAAQQGDSGGLPNIVGGTASGECAGLV